jgi:hypothetical protein
MEQDVKKIISNPPLPIEIGSVDLRKSMRGMILEAKI